jgi:F-type H+-transporting ATPase subunit delta
MSDRTDLYASAFLSLVRAEGSGNEVLDELFRVSRTIEGNDELRTALSDPHLPADRRTQIVQDLLEGKAHALTISLVSTTITNGRVRDLPIIVDSMLARNAATGDKVVAQVRSAVALTVDVDPSVLGGIVTQIGDTVIDGSVRQRLSQLRESF